jgi:AraC-like DNA-binding protein
VGPSLARSCRELLSVPLALAASGNTAQAHAHASELLRTLARELGFALLAVALCVGLGTFLAQGPAFARLSSFVSSRFAPLSPSRTASALWCLGLAFVTLLSLSEWLRFERAALVDLACQLAQRVALLTVACMAIDLGFARARHFASLWLTRREQLDEQRAHYGAPEVRVARERARRTLAVVAPAPARATSEDS